MKFKKEFLKNYLKEAPVSLAIERTFECEILSGQKFERPILDIGCGEGLFAYILFDEKIDVGIDPNSKELKRARQHSMYEELINCFGDRIPKPDKAFKTIFSNSVIEHIKDVNPVLAEARRLLADDGSIFLTVPTNNFDKFSILYQLFNKIGLNSVAEKYRMFFNKFWQHFHYYDINGWEEIFRGNNLIIVDVKQYCPAKVCLLNDFFAPFSIFRLFIKKLFNRWYIFKPLISAGAVIKYIFCKSIVNIDKDIKNGGIVFFHLKK